MMLGYYDVFPDKWRTELRNVLIPEHDGMPFPAGTYMFTEYYCSDLSCDCQRLLVKVLHFPGFEPSPDVVPTEVATFNYSWNENPDESWKRIIGEMPNPFLDPLHPQASYADQVMEFWHDMVQHDLKYAERLRKHYVELRRIHGERGRRTACNRMSGMLVATDPAEKKRRFRALRQQQQKKRRGQRKMR